MLKCSRCGEMKPTGDFSPQPSNGRRGHSAYCKPCNAASNREQYARSREQGAARARAYRQSPEVKERISAYNKEYRKKNPERMRAFDNAPEKRARDRAREKTPEGRQAKVLAFHRRRARMLNGDGVSAEQWQARLVEFNFLCAYCLQPGQMTMEHMLPLSRGGEHSISNVIPACQSCNSQKSTKNLLEFLSIQGRRV